MDDNVSEDCTICTETLGSTHRPAVQLPCGHAFCSECVVEWQRNKHNDCPQCRQEFSLARVRPLWPWRNGLRLKEPAHAEQQAVKALDEVRAARKAEEARAAKMERALRQLQGEAQAGSRPLVLGLVTSASAAQSMAKRPPIDGVVASTLGATSSAGGAAELERLAQRNIGVSRPAPAEPSHEAPPRPPGLAAATFVPTVLPAAAAAASSGDAGLAALTAEQQARVLANREAALERKRKREEALALEQEQEQRQAQRGASARLTGP